MQAHKEIVQFLSKLQTEESFQWTDSVKPVMLPQLDAANPPGVQGLVTGWKINVTVRSQSKK